MNNKYKYKYIKYKTLYKQLQLAGKCSICEANKVNKITCPFNIINPPKHPKPKLHNKKPIHLPKKTQQVITFTLIKHKKSNLLDSIEVPIFSNETILDVKKNLKKKLNLSLSLNQILILDQEFDNIENNEYIEDFKNDDIIYLIIEDMMVN